MTLALPKILLSLLSLETLIGHFPLLRPFSLMRLKLVFHPSLHLMRVRRINTIGLSIPMVSSLFPHCGTILELHSLRSHGVSAFGSLDTFQNAASFLGLLSNIGFAMRTNWCYLAPNLFPNSHFAKEVKIITTFSSTALIPLGCGTKSSLSLTLIGLLDPGIIGSII